MKTVLGLVKFVVVFYILAVVILYVFQRKFLYHPRRGVNSIEAKKIEIKHDDVVLKGWVLNEGRDKAILYYGGNAESIENNIPIFKEIFKGYTAYLINYRGYGLSEGNPTESNLYSDAIYIYDRIKPEYKKICLIGRSLGTAVAVYVASKKKVEKLVLITPFDSIKNVAQQIFWMFPIPWLIKDKYESNKLVKNISAKTLILLAGNDDIIPAKRSDALISLFDPELLTVKTIKGAGHNSISYFPEFSEDLEAFLRDKGSEPGG